jgi:hypothetical protein
MQKLPILDAIQGTSRCLDGSFGPLSSGAIPNGIRQAGERTNS